MEIDALGETVGGDEDDGLLVFGPCLAECGDAILAFVSGVFAGDGVHGDLFEGCGEVLGDVAGGGDVAAEDDRAEAVGKEIPEVRDEGCEFGIACGTGELAGGSDEGLEVAGLIVEGGSGFEVAEGEIGTGIVEKAIGSVGGAVLGAWRTGGGEPGFEGFCGGCGRRGHAAQHGEGGVPDHACLMAERMLGAGGEADAVVSDVVEELAPLAGELVGYFPREASWEDGCVLPFLDVFTAALNEVAGKVFAERAALMFVFPEAGEFRAKQGEEIVERVVIAGVGGSGEQEEVAVFLGRELLEQFEPELSTLAIGAGVGFVDDDELGSDREEVFAVTLAFDVVEADDDEWVLAEERCAWRQRFFEPGGTGGSEGDGAEVETGFEFRDPLFDEVRRAEDGAAGDFVAIKELADDESGLDGFADADIVGDEEPDDGEPEGHEERNELIGSRFDGDVSEGPERAGAVAQTEVDGVAEERCALMISWAGGIRRRKESGRRRFGFEIREDEGDIVI